MYFAVLYMMVVDSTRYLMVEPMESYNQCKTVAEVMYKNRNAEYPDAKCVAIIFDKDSSK